MGDQGISAPQSSADVASQEVSGVELQPPPQLPVIVTPPIAVMKFGRFSSPPLPSSPNSCSPSFSHQTPRV